MKFEIVISKEDYRNIQKNKYAHESVLTRGYMLDILHDIIDQMDVSRPYKSHLYGKISDGVGMTVEKYNSADRE
jgi:hypothetical protein